MLATAMSFPSVAVAAISFVDDFSTDTSANYTGTDTFGSGGSFDVSGGTLNVTSAGNNTYNVFNNTASYGIGDTICVDISGPSNAYLSVSTTTRAANTAGEDGVRLHWDTGGVFRIRTYTNGTGTDTNFDAAAITGSVTLCLTRVTDNTYSATANGTLLETAGGTSVFTAGDTGNGDMFFGVEAFNTGTRAFDNLCVTPVPEPTSTALLGLGGIALILRRRK